MESFYGWAGLLLGFSGLIFIHELGHFLLAKWNGVHVHVFSIGMGPYLISFTHKRTVYALSLIPIGGYVKLMGQDDLNADMAANKNPADFRNKRPGQKAAILAAGAAFNIATTLIIFAICYYAGYKVQTPCLGEITKDKPLAQAKIIDNEKSNTAADLRKGDRILSVNGVRVKSYFDVMLQVTAQSSNDPVELYIERKEQRDRNGNPLRQHVLVDMEQDKKQGVPNIGLGADTVYKEEEPLALGFTTEVCVFVGADPLKDSPAEKAGLKKGDRIRSVEDRTDPTHVVSMKMESGYSLINASALSKGEERVFVIERDGKPLIPEPKIKSTYNAEEGSYKFGILPAVYHRVTRIDENSDAYKAGLREKCLVERFLPDNPNVFPWKSGKLVWDTSLDDKNPSEVKLKVPELSANNELVFRQSYVVGEVFKAGGPSGGLGDAIGQSWDDTRHYTICMFATLRNLITQRVNAKNLSGAVGIGHTIFDVASKQTFLEYLWWLAFISLNLGVMQLLPIPLLDGFHLVMVLVEKIKGSMVPAKVQEKFMYAGIAIIGFLLIFVTYHDIARFISNKF